MKKLFRCLALVAALGLPVLMAGCSSDNSSSNGNRTETVFGKVVDNATRKTIVPVSGSVKVTVELLDNASKLVTSTVANPADADLDGTFKFDGVPAGNHTIRITVTDDPAIPANAVSLYAVKTMNLVGTGNAGIVSVNKGFDTSFYVTSKGTPVADVIVRATDSTGNVAGTATTDANGKVSFTGLDQLDTYTITTSPKFDSTGKLQYTAGFIAGYQYANTLGGAGQINIIPVTRTTAIQSIASNLFNFVPDPANINMGGSGHGLIDTTNYLTSKDSDVRVVFNLPVNLDAANLTISFFDDQQTGPVSASVLFNTKQVTPAAAPVLSADNTILTIPAPTGGYKALEAYTIQGGVTASVNAGVDQATWGGLQFVVTDASSAVTADPIIDNFNSSKNGTLNTVGSPAVAVTGAGAANRAFLVFSEPVYGTVRIIGTQLGNAVSETIINGDQIRINGLLSNGNIVFAPNPRTTGATTAANNPVAGTSAGSVFRFDLALGVVNDDNTGAVNKIRLYVDVVDTHGNRIQKELTLGVL